MSACTCRPGIERDNCPRCEGSGETIDFAALRARSSVILVDGGEMTETDVPPFIANRMIVPLACLDEFQQVSAKRKRKLAKALRKLAKRGKKLRKLLKETHQS